MTDNTKDLDKQPSSEEPDQDSVKDEQPESNSEQTSEASSSQETGDEAKAASSESTSKPEAPAKSEESTTEASSASTDASPSEAVAEAANSQETASEAESSESTSESTSKPEEPAKPEESAVEASSASEAVPVAASGPEASPESSETAAADSEAASGPEASPESSDAEADMGRRELLANALMLGTVGASYATALGFASYYLYPSKAKNFQNLFVGMKSQLVDGAAKPFTTPDGQTITVLRQGEEFLALSNVCPHLGCRVHWDRTKKEFLCPCHDGHFDATGAPTGGPPLAENMPLSRFPITVENGMVYLKIEV